MLKFLSEAYRLPTNAFNHCSYLNCENYGNKDTSKAVKFANALCNESCFKNVSYQNIAKIIYNHSKIY